MTRGAGIEFEGMSGVVRMNGIGYRLPNMNLANLDSNATQRTVAYMDIDSTSVVSYFFFEHFKKLNYRIGHLRSLIKRLSGMHTMENCHKLVQSVDIQGKVARSTFSLTIFTSLS